MPAEPLKAPAPSAAPRPQMPSTPPPEVLKMEFSTEGVDLESGSQQVKLIDDRSGKEVKQPEVKAPSTTEVKTEVEKKPADTKIPSEAKVEEVKEEKKSEDGLKKFLKPPTTDKKEEKKEDKAPEVKVEDKGQQQIKLPEKGQFDYSGYSQAEVTALKNMSKEAREFTAGVIKQNKEMSKARQESYLQHPEAYTLIPEYRQAQTDMQFVEAEGRYWQSQLEQCALGKPVKPLTGWDKQGKPVFGAEIPSSPRVEEAIRMDMQKAFGEVQRIQGQLNGVKQRFSTEIQRNDQMIEQERSRRFQWAADPALMEHSLEIDGKQRTLKQIHEDIASIFPSYYRNTPMAKVCGDLMISLRIAQAELAEARAGGEVTQTKLEEVQRGEPQSQERVVPVDKANKKTPNEFTLVGGPEI